MYNRLFNFLAQIHTHTALPNGLGPPTLLGPPSKGFPKWVTHRLGSAMATRGWDSGDREPMADGQSASCCGWPCDVALWQERVPLGNVVVIHGVL